MCVCDTRCGFSVIMSWCALSKILHIKLLNGASSVMMGEKLPMIYSDVSVWYVCFGLKLNFNSPIQMILHIILWHLQRALRLYRCIHIGMAFRIISVSIYADVIQSNRRNNGIKRYQIIFHHLSVFIRVFNKDKFEFHSDLKSHRLKR